MNKFISGLPGKIAAGLVFTLSTAMFPSIARAQVPQPIPIEVSPGVVLHYTDTGSGPPLIVVHGSTGDYRGEELAPLSQQYRVITYSRRYNYPNSNVPIDGYSAKVDARDLQDLIKALELERVFVFGFSYGAFTTMFLLTEHPELVRAAVLAEPPAISLLRGYPPSPESGRAMEMDVHERMVAPMAAAFRKGDHVEGMRAFYNYVAGEGVYDSLPESVRSQGLANAMEWEVMLTRGNLFPDIDSEAVRKIETPVLLLAGSEHQKDPFLLMVHETLAAILPNNRQVVIQGAPHPMFATHPDQARGAVSDFFSEHGGESR